MSNPFRIKQLVKFNIYFAWQRGSLYLNAFQNRQMFKNVYVVTASIFQVIHMGKKGGD